MFIIADRRGATMSKLVIWTYEHSRRMRWAWVGVLAVVGGLALWSASRAHYSVDLFDALPENAVLDRYKSLLRSGSDGASRLVVGFSGGKGTSIKALANAADRFVAGLDTSFSVDSAFFRPDPTALDQAYSEILADLPLFADSALLARVAALDSLQVDSAVAAWHAGFTRPGAEMGLDRFAGDPFGLTGPLVERLLSSGSFGELTLIDGGLFSADSTMAVVVVVPVPGDDVALVHTLEAGISRVAEPGITGAAFGAAPMAVVNAQRISIDAWVTSSVAFVGIVLLLVWRFRSLRLPLLFLVPPVFGLLVGLGAVALLRPMVSGLALGASAALLGIAFDYGFHYFVHLRHSGSVADTLRNVARPMLLGCTTTVLAFLVLSFVGGRVLADLGLIAAFMLVATALCVLFVLPHFTPVPALVSKARTDAVPTSPPALRWRLIAVAGISAVLLPFVGQVQYDSDPEHLGYIPPAMRLVRDKVEGDSGRAVPVFWAASGRSLEEARQALERSAERVRAAQDDRSFTVLLPTDLQPSAQRATIRRAAWGQTFGEGRGERLHRWIADAVQRRGFVPDALSPFMDQLVQSPERSPGPTLHAMGGEVVGTTGIYTTVAGRVLIPPTELDPISTQVMHDQEAMFLHRGLLSGSIEKLVGDDLSAILWRTSLIVFLTLLIAYGRIELALLTFLPMALGWLWILGLCGLLGIAFNLVNILVCTFVFGLGDDYCIFTTEGLLARYRSGSDNTRSFREAVVLSALTTIIGTGVLLFAQHPALRSIAVLSVTGMAVLLVISLTVQPVLFHLFIGGRAAKGHQPFTLSSFLISAFAFAYFLLGCVLLSLFWLLLQVFPAPKRSKQQALRSVVRLFTGSLVYVMVNTRKDIQGFHSAIAERPAVVIANHASFIDILAMLMVSPNVVMITNRWVWNSPFFGRVVRYAGYLRTEDGVEANTERAREAMDQGLSVIIFPEGTRSRDGRIGRFHKGAFAIAQALQAPIVPVVLHGFGHAMTKGDGLLKNALLTMRTLPVIEPGDTRFGTDLRLRTKAVATWFKAEYEEVRRARETPRWFHERLVSRFTYKGPVLEWHTRVKASLDLDLHELLHARIPHNALVADLGCGHGMVSFLLHWCGPERKVLGLDRDPEKVAIAAQTAGTEANLSFREADLEQNDPPPADTYLMKDVLHYLTEGRQRTVLLACASALPPGGAIFVREGFLMDGARHQRTRWTERISTGIGFNAAQGPLCFMTKRTLEAIATEAGLQVEWVLASTRTSNELAVLTKQA